MNTPIEIQKIISDNPNVDVRALKEGEDALKELQRAGIVTNSTYGLATPESKKELRPDRSTADLLRPFRKLY